MTAFKNFPLILGLFLRLCSCQHFYTLEDQCPSSTLKNTEGSHSEGDSSVQAKFRKRGSQLWLDLRKVTVAITAFGLQKPTAATTEEDTKNSGSVSAPPDQIPYDSSAEFTAPPPPDFADIELHDVSDVMSLETPEMEAGNPGTGTLSSCRWISH